MNFFLKRKRIILFDMNNQKLEEICKTAFDNWNASLKEGPEAVLMQYCNKKGVLIPTVDGTVCDNPAKIKNYFEHFCEKLPEGKITEYKIIQSGEDTIIYTGHYQFNLQKTQQIVDARFTYVFEKQENSEDWKIIHHHSSANPTSHPPKLN